MLNAVQVEWPGQPAILVAKISAGIYWLSTRWFDQRHERLVSVEDREDFWPDEVLEIANAS